ncbi:superoxide dismutase [Subtercola sp. Z020]|uniref:superoxide dismutase n=1 Tax=Subtercola sp. Z020 TaxID=2080582 RepID=UPI000CE7B075|nr:superoxide dismutase [Subtercola sp. Z020]PPF86159.1 superoxide dismutase [Subtercola sp. Z020]
MAEYTLPDLPYDYAALEPHISATIMQLHHDKHHATYVAGANTANSALADARDKGDLAAVNKFEKDLAFNLGGHVNHSIFWTNLTPDTSEPTGALAEAIGADFGDLEKFKAHFTAVALGVQGSGWSVLAYDVLGQKLSIFQLFDQQGNVPFGLVPLLMLDVWEHAYYIDYKNVRADYIKAFWNIVNWENVAARYAAATEKTNGLLVLS